MFRLNGFPSLRVGQLQIKWCHCLLPAGWEIHIMHHALDLITQKRRPPTHTLLLSLARRTYVQAHLLNNKATVVQIF